MKTIRIVIACAAMTASAAFAGPLHPMGPSPTGAVPAAAAMPTQPLDVNSVVLANLATAKAATSAHNNALLARGDLCAKRVRIGLIKPTATAQMNCLLARD